MKKALLIFILALQIFSTPCFLPYQANQPYASGSEVSYFGKNYKAKWWTTAIPGTETFVADWDELGNCEETNNTNKTVCFPAFESGKEYITGSQVTHNNRNYIAKWSTRETPGVENWGGWEDLGICEIETIIDFTTNEEEERTTIESVSQFLLFATNNLNLNSGVKIAGNIGANGNVSVGDIAAGWQTLINGDIYAKGKVSTIAEASINGNVYAKNLELGWQARHDGELFENFDFDFNIEKKTIQTSSQNIDGRWREDITLSAGNYNNVSIKDGGSLQLSKGIYNAKTLSLNSNDLEIKLNIAPGDNVELNIQDSLHLGSGTKISFAGKKSPLNFKIYTNQTKDLIIPDHSEINAIITAPNAKVIVNSGAKINGAIFAKEIEVKYGAVINDVPYITDIFHSEYHFAPEFDIKNTEYFSVISPSANIEFVEVQTAKNYKVTQTKTGEKYIFEIEDTASGIVSYYSLDFQRAYNNYCAVFVNSNVSGGNGNSWSSALNNLQEAVKLAKKEGREIRVAEGNYGNITIGQGTKIIGGYSGNEGISDTAQGSPYKTVLDGVNNTQTLVIKGFSNAKSVKIKGLTFQNGYSETNGAGIYSEKVIPKFEEIIVQNNTAKENGAGIYAPKGVQDLHMVLLENNTGKSAFYIGGKDSVKAEKVVVSQNSNVGLEVKNANISFVNSIFYGNKTAVSADNSNLEIIHNTFTKSDTGIVAKNSTVKIINTILWNEKKELSGNGFEVSFSCSNKEISGETNILIPTFDNVFVDVAAPKGSDGLWGTFDDGLSLRRGIPILDKGKDSVAMFDIKDIERPLGSGFDMGAYEITVLPEGDSEADFGVLKFNNEFIRQEGIGDFVVKASSKRDLYKLMFGRSALTLRIYVEKHDYVRKNISSGTGYVSVEKDGKKITDSIPVTLYQNGENSAGLIFTSQKFESSNTKNGKPIFLVLENDPQKLNALRDNRYHILPVDTNTTGASKINLRVYVPTGQF